MRLSYVLACAALALAAPARAQYTYDGLITEPDWILLDDDTGGPNPGFAIGHEINALYADVDPVNQNLLLAIAGNVQDGNRILVFMDTRAGGYANGNFGRAGAPGGINNFNSGTTFDEGFLPDYALVVGTDGGRTDFYFNLYTLSGTAGSGGGPDVYLGSANSQPFIGASPLNNSLTNGFELLIPYAPSGGVITVDQPAQFMAMYTGDSGYLSNQFISPAGSGEGNYEGGAVSFGSALPNPVALVWETLQGQHGWRHLAWPVVGGTVAHLARQNLVQGVTGSYPTGGDNVLIGYSPSGFIPATDVAEPLPSGEGLFWYHYVLADFLGATPPPEWTDLPYALKAGGLEPRAPLGPYSTVSVAPGYEPTAVAPSYYYLLGNPFAASYDLQAMTVGGLYVANTIAFVWDPNMALGGGYTFRSRVDPTPANRLIAPMQGFVIEGLYDVTASGPITFNFPPSGRAQGAPFYGRSAEPLRRLALALDVEVDGAFRTADETARVWFAAEATDGRDAYDASEPPSPAATAVSLAFAGADGRLLAQEGRPLEPVSALDLPLQLHLAGVPADGRYRLRWPELAGIPDAWALAVTDLATGVRIDLREGVEHVFTASPGDAAGRFVLHVTPSGVVAGEDTPEGGFALAPMAPNPAAESALTTLRVDRAQRVRAALFDALGRRVAEVLDGVVEAGAPTALALDVRHLPAGTYVLRVDGESFRTVRRVTVAR